MVMNSEYSRGTQSIAACSSSSIAAADVRSFPFCVGVNGNCFWFPSVHRCWQSAEVNLCVHCLLVGRICVLRATSGEGLRHSRWLGERPQMIPLRSGIGVVVLGCCVELSSPLEVLSSVDLDWSYGGRFGHWHLIVLGELPGKKGNR